MAQPIRLKHKYSISLVKDKPPSLSSPLSSPSTSSSSLSSRHTNIKRSQKTTKPLDQQESTLPDEERGKSILMFIFMNSFAHVPGDGLLFWSSIPSSSSRTTEIREPVTAVLWDTENRRVLCKLECVHKESVNKTCPYTTVLRLLYDFSRRLFDDYSLIAYTTVLRLRYDFSTTFLRLLFEFKMTVSRQEPITRSLQLPHIPIMAFSQTDLILV